VSERDANGPAGDGPPKARERRPESAVVSLLTVAVAVVVAVVFQGVLRWVAIAAAVTVGPELFVLVPAGVRRRALRVAPVLLVVAVATGLLWDLVVGHAPASRDHAIHYFQTSVLVEQMLPSGRLSGWTDRLNNGYPFGESYPTLGHLWVAAPHLLTFGALDLRTSYAWGLLGVWALAIASVWWLAHTIAGEVAGGSSKQVAWAGCVGSLAWLLDPGGSRQGGWSYVMFHGVWPQMLSAAFWTLSLVLTWRALQAASPRRLALAGGVLGASVLAHPFGLLTAVASALGWLVVLLVMPDGRAVASGRLRLWLLVHLIAAGLAFGAMSVFFGSAASMGRSPVPWAPLEELATGLITGGLFDAQAPWAGVLAVLGIVVVLHRGKVMSWLALALALGMIVLGSHAAITTLRFDLIVSGFENLQFPRYAIAIKPLIFAFAGVGALVVARGLKSWGAGHETRVGPRPLRFVAALVLAPFIVGVGQDAGRLFARPVGGIDTLQASGLASHESAMLEALRAEAERSPGGLRVAFLRTGMGGATYPIFTIADAGADLVLDGHVATINFEHRFGPRTPPALAAMGVTHVIRDRDLGDDEEALAGALEKIGVYGPHTVSRFRFDAIGRHPVTATRPGAMIELIEEHSERLVVDVDGVSRRTAITLLRAPHVRWRATFDGAPIDILESRLHSALPVMRITVPGSGRLVLRYHRSQLETIATWTSVVTLGLVLLALAVPRRIELADRLHGPAAQRLSALLIGLCVALALLWLARRQAAQLEATWNEAIHRVVPRQPNVASPVFVRDLVIDDAVESTRSVERICDGLLGKDALEGCSEAAHRPSMALAFNPPHLYRCLAVTVPPKGVAKVDLGSARSVVGMVARLEGDGRGLTWAVHPATDDERPHPVRRRPTDFHLQGDGIALRLVNRSGTPQRICVAAAEVRPKATGASGAALD
jgi:hypothetical protein